MTDPRIKDSIRNTEKLVAGLTKKVDKVLENQVEILKIVRAIKRSTVRGYKKPTIIDKVLGSKEPTPSNDYREV